MLQHVGCGEESQGLIILEVGLTPEVPTHALGEIVKPSSAKKIRRSVKPCISQLVATRRVIRSNCALRGVCRTGPTTNVPRGSWRSPTFR